MFEAEVETARHSMAQTVLVVDDDPMMHWVSRRYLEKAGYRMLSASNGREALEVVAHELHQVIVLDLRMSEMDGLTALKRLKQDPRTNTIPVIVVTVSDDLLTQMKSEFSGASVYLTKPFSPAQLLAEIRRFAPESAAAPGST